MEQKRENWGSKTGFILAAAGSAIGLGNIWKFPYIAGENGGASFIIVYLICIAVIGLPVLIAEVLIGRTAQRDPVGAFYKLSQSRIWASVGQRRASRCPLLPRRDATQSAGRCFDCPDDAATG